jgi:hypothetical protein
LTNQTIGRTPRSSGASTKLTSENQERHRHGAERERPFALAEQAHGDDARERCRSGVDQVVAQQDHAEQLVGLCEERKRKSRAARTALRLVLQPIAVRRHHRRLGNREKSRRHQQDDQRQRQRAQGNVVQAAVFT